jgi:hypothetical protein
MQHVGYQELGSPDPGSTGHIFDDGSTCSIPGMEKPQLRRIIGVAMVAIGLLQASLGSLNEDLIFALLGLTYALIGVAYLWFEGNSFDQ